MPHKRQKKKPSFKPPVVFAIHGIRTSRKKWWGTQLDAFLQEQGIHTDLREYGWFPAAGLMFKASRDAQVNGFYNWYCEQMDKWQLSGDNPSKLPSVIAHSFGTFIVGKAMLKYPDVRFDKVVFCGSILPENFPWGDIFGNGQVGALWNDFGGKDFWVSVVPFVAGETGRAGRYGFSLDNPLHFSNGQKQKTHCDYFKKQYWKSSWLPFLLSPPRGAIIKHGGMCHTADEMEQMLSDTDAIDTDVYGPLPYYQAARCTVAEELAWAQKEPEIYTFLLEQVGSRAVGYVNAAPVSDEYFATIKQGSGGTRNMQSSDIVQFENYRNVKLYIVSIAVDQALHAKTLRGVDEAAHRLIFACIEKLRRFQDFRGIGVEELIATVWTSQGRGLCQKVGMQDTGIRDRCGHEVWWGNLDPKSLPRNSPFLDYFKRNQSVVYENRKRGSDSQDDRGRTGTWMRLGHRM